MTKIENLMAFPVIALLFGLLTGCGRGELPEWVVPEAESEFAEDFLDRLRQGDMDYVKTKLDPDVTEEASDELINRVIDFFPEGEPISTKIIGSQVRAFNSEWEGNFTFEYEFPSGWALANTVVRRAGEDFLVGGFHVYRTEASQAEINRFTLSGKSVLHYGVLGGATIAPIFILFTLVSCIRTPIHKRKWLWVLFVIVGIGTIRLNWTTGAYSIQMFSINLLGSGAVADGPFAPWVVSTGIPLGAILFWFRRKRFIAIHEANKPLEPDT